MPGSGHVYSMLFSPHLPRRIFINPSQRLKVASCSVNRSVSTCRPGLIKTTRTCTLARCVDRQSRTHPPGPSAVGRQIHVLWDLDNKQIDAVDASHFIQQLLQLVSPYGEVATKYAVGNYATFNFVPRAVQAARREQREFIKTEHDMKGVGEVYKCDMCGRRFNTMKALQVHFKNLHDREFRKQQRHPKVAARQAHFRGAGEKFFDAKWATGIQPEKGTNLKWHLMKAGFECLKVEVTDQAADKLLSSKAASLLHNLRAAASADTQHMLCLVSDDRDFTNTLRAWKDAGLCTMIACNVDKVGEYPFADIVVDWQQLYNENSRR